ncbi:MAG: replication initiator protein [Microviridae sp.]|nr:MAG: replication initiator protein [Microviridae sp.]
MPCFHPIKGYFSNRVNKNGKRPLVFSPDNAVFPNPQFIPCSRCFGCRLDRAHQWAVRCMHEASMHDHNCFITLTFDDKHLGDGSLHKDDFQNFMKRLRKKIHPLKVRYFHCGEYGSKHDRPHHHAIIFGYDFKDKIEWQDKNGVKTYLSEELMELWPDGFSTISGVTFDSCAYVTRYVLKKWSSLDLQGEELFETMKQFDISRGCLVKGSWDGVDILESLDIDLKDVVPSVSRRDFYSGKLPEYVSMSLKPGIGEEWFCNFYKDIYPSGFVVINHGRKVKPPKFYDLKYEVDFPFDSAMVKAERAKRSLLKQYTQADLDLKEFIQMQSINQLNRSYENAD